MELKTRFTEWIPTITYSPAEAASRLSILTVRCDFRLEILFRKDEEQVVADGHPLHPTVLSGETQAYCALLLTTNAFS